MPARRSSHQLPDACREGDLKFPQYAVLGYSFRPTPDWNIEADIDWTDWDSLNTFTLNRSDGSTVKVPFDWTHSFMYELGVTHIMGPYKLSAGYMYSENSVPSATFNPLIPDSARKFSPWAWGEHSGVAAWILPISFGLGATRTIVNDSVGRWALFFPFECRLNLCRISLLDRPGTSRRRGAWHRAGWRARQAGAPRRRRRGGAAPIRPHHLQG